MRLALVLLWCWIWDGMDGSDNVTTGTARHVLPPDGLTIVATVLDDTR
jgi:hypothetical protein